MQILEPSSPLSFQALPSSAESAADLVPGGAWAIGVSGGADSMALLNLLLERPARPDNPLHLCVLHLDHETRAGQSTADARFVEQFCERRQIPCVLATRSQIERTFPESGIAANLSSRYRLARLAFFHREVTQQKLHGVLLAHHAGDWAETVLQRLLRSSPHSPSPGGLIGIRPDAIIGNLRILRPLLAVDPADLRAWLLRHGIEWREDASNASPDYLRNRLRLLLQTRPGLCDALRSLSTACDALHHWTLAAAPVLPNSFPADQLARLPVALAEASAQRWLAAQGSPPDKLNPPVLHRLIQMARDAATPSRQDFPGNLPVSRRAGIISTDNA